MNKLKTVISNLQHFYANSELVSIISGYYKLHIPLLGVLDEPSFYQRQQVEFSIAQMQLIRQDHPVYSYEYYACSARESLLEIVTPLNTRQNYNADTSFVNTLTDAATAYAYVSTPPNFDRRKEFLTLIHALLQNKLTKFMD